MTKSTGLLDTVNIEAENVVWMDPVGNIDAEEDLQNEDPQRVAPKKRKRPECKHGK